MSEQSDGEITQQRYDGDPDEWSYGDPTVGYNVPISVRTGGATKPMEREEIGENGVALRGHSAPYDCENCGHTQHFVTDEYVTQYNCRGCGNVTWFRLQGWEDAE